MSTLTIFPIPEVFSHVPHLSESLQEFKERKVVEELIPKLGQIFVKHDVYDKFAISLVHRHFELTPQEILVEAVKQDGTMSVFLPWDANLEKGVCLPPTESTSWTSYNLEGSKRSFVSPQNWCFSEGQFVPFEFFATQDPQITLPPKEFVNELYEVIKAYGVERYVGLRRFPDIHRDSWETTPEGKRANVVVFGERPDHIKDREMVQVSWYFDKDGVVQRGAEWCAVCVGNWCGKCK